MSEFEGSSFGELAPDTFAAMLTVGPSRSCVGVDGAGGKAAIASMRSLAKKCSGHAPSIMKDMQASWQCHVKLISPDVRCASQPGAAKRRDCPN